VAASIVRYDSLHLCEWQPGRCDLSLARAVRSTPERFKDELLIKRYTKSTSTITYYLLYLYCDTATNLHFARLTRKRFIVNLIDS